MPPGQRGSDNEGRRKDMKKIFLIVMVLALVFSLSACGGNTQAPAEPEDEPVVVEDEVEDETDDGAMVGAWEADESIIVTDEQAEVFEKAMSSFVGVEYRPLARVASQIVAGTNHVFVCAAKAVVPDAQEYYAIVYIYEDLQGNATVTDVYDFGRGTDVPAEPLPGGWSYVTPPVISEEVMTAFDKAMDGMVGVEYHPVACLSSQVVSGMNWCVLCESKGVYPGAEQTYSLVYIYADLNGNAEVTDIVDLLKGTV